MRKLVLPVVPRQAAGSSARVQEGLLGFSPPRAAAEREAERRFLAGIDTARMSATHRAVTAHPHIAGSARSMAVAGTLQAALQEAGQTDPRYGLSTPRSIAVEIVSPIARPICR
ncbi:MAG: hypothetical protein R2712_02390 [Vicinamibacterales bacterium]